MVWDCPGQFMVLLHTRRSGPPALQLCPPPYDVLAVLVVFRSEESVPLQLFVTELEHSQRRPARGVYECAIVFHDEDTGQRIIYTIVDVSPDPVLGHTFMHICNCEQSGAIHRRVKNAPVSFVSAAATCAVVPEVRM